MRLFDRLPHVWSSGATDAEHNRPIPSTKQHSFKPKAIRIPALLSLLCLFTICLAWLEILLDRTVKPSEYYKSHGINDGLKKRQAVSPNQCPAPNINAQNLASLRSKHSELCSSYTTVFKPETTDLPPPIQTSFDQWLDIYSSMEALSELAESCALSQFSSSAMSSLLSSLATRSAVTSASTSDIQSSDSLATTSAATLLSQSLNTTSTAVVGTTIAVSNSITAATGSDTSALTSAQSFLMSSATTLASASTNVASSPGASLSDLSQRSNSSPNSPAVQGSSAASIVVTSTDQPSTSSTATAPPDTNSSSNLSDGAVVESRTSLSNSAISSGSTTEDGTRSPGSSTSSISSFSNGTTPATTPTDMIISEVSSDLPSTSTNTASDTIAALEGSAITTISPGPSTAPGTTTNTTASSDVITSFITTSNVTTPDTTTTSPETLVNTTTLSNIIPFTPETSTSTTTSNSTISTPETTTNTTAPTDALTTPAPTPIPNTTTSTNTTITPETSTNTNTSEIKTSTDPPVDNSTVCVESGQSCNDGCDASICTCQSSYVGKRSDLVCMPDPCACQQDPSNSSHVECSEAVNICDDTCTGPFTPEGDPCNCESETCFCQNSVCTIESECVSGEPCSSCEAEKCICRSSRSASLLRRTLFILTGRSETICSVDQCYCSYNEDLTEWQCGDTNYCSIDSIYSNSSTLSPTPDSTTPNVTASAPTTTDPTTSETSTSSSSTITPVPCTPGTACDSCTADYCSCSSFPTIGPSCAVDTCSCSSLSGTWHCNTINLCTSTSATLTSTTRAESDITTSSSTTITPAPCTPGSACDSCTAEHCACSSLPTIGPSCAVDTCFCSLSSGKWYCNTINLCSSTSTSLADDPDTTTSSSSSTITPAPCTPGSACNSCAADVCSCSSFPTIGPSCVVDNCSCSLETTRWQCNTYNLCTSTSTAPSTITSEEPDPSRSCQPGNPCQNCGANSCYCRDDGYCEVGEQTETSTCDNCTAVGYSRIRRGPAKVRFLADEWSGGRHQEDTPRIFPHVLNARDFQKRRLEDSNGENRGSSLKPRNIWGIMDKRQGIEILTGDYQIPIRDAWNYLLWTSPLTVRRTSSSTVSTTVAATFTLDVFPGGFTSWPSLTSTPPLATQSKEPACIPATLIQPILSMRAKRDASVSVIKSVKPYVTRESTTVVVKIRDNYLETTSNVPTITQAVANLGTISGALQALTSQTITIETIAPDGSTQTLSVVVIKPSDNLIKGAEPAATVQRLGTPQETSVSLSGGDNEDGSSNGNGGGGGGGGGGAGDGNGSAGGEDTKTNSADKHVQKLTDNQRVVDMHYTAASYFGSMYAPAITAIMVKILFEPMLAALKGMEPFERLHREQGAIAEDSLCSQYLSSSLSWDTIRSIWSGSSIPLWTTIIYVMVSISAPLASASMTVRPMDECWMDNTWKMCAPAWVIDIRFLRALEALLVICIVLTLVLLWSSWKYHAGVPTNPTSIASVAVLLNYEPLRQDLQAIDPEATEDEFERALEEYHFWLIAHSPSRTESRYGFVHTQTTNPLTTPDAPKLPSFLAKFETRYNRLRPHLHSRHSIRLGDSLHIFTTLALLAILTTYRANTNNDKFNYFFASNTFWPKLITVALATSLDMQWKSLEREVRITEPYRRLYLGNARPENTILRSLNGTCWSNLPRAMRDLSRYSHMWFEALVGLTAILSDINIIAVSGVLMTYSQTRVAYQWSSITALITTSFMFSVLLLVTFWWRRTDAVAGMPRTPETVGAVLSYLCISRMAMDFANMGMENLGKDERDRSIVGMGRRYRFGRMMGEDGKGRYCVDYEDENDQLEGEGEENERTSWLRAKMERPVPVRLST